MKEDTINSEPEYRDKFIAFVDILGFRSKVEEIGDHDESKLSELLEQCHKLAQKPYTRQISEYGPVICPESRHSCRSLDYQVTQISDCVIVSSEISPAGIIHLLQHVSATVLSLLRHGIMVRGYVSKGKIYHTNSQFIGPGYHKVHDGEKNVGAFRLPSDNYSTPFVEIDPIVVDYIKTETDQCVTKVFKRLSREDESGIAVVFPFNVFSELAGGNFHDTEKCKEDLRVVRGWIEKFLQKLELQSPHSDLKADQKAKYYRKFLNEQLEWCNNIERNLELMHKPFMGLRYDADLKAVYDPDYEGGSLD